MAFTKKTVALLRSLFAIDEEGNTYLRVVTADAEAGQLKNATSTQSNRSLETLLANSIVLDADGNPALRLVSVPFGTSVEEADRAKRHALEEEKKVQQAKRLKDQKKRNKDAMKKKTADAKK